MSLVFIFVSSGNETDHEALMKIRSMITQDPYGTLNSWNNSLHFCNWIGVTCGKRHKRVTYLQLNSYGLEGSLSPHVGNLSFLRGLFLYNNSFQGTIPDEIGRLFRLRSLALKLNKFNGVIPANISSGCSNLELLDLSYNELVGSIPKETSLLFKLTFVSLSNNNLVGGISPSLGNISSIKVFSVTSSLRSTLTPVQTGPNQTKKPTFDQQRWRGNVRFALAVVGKRPICTVGVEGGAVTCLPRLNS
ncbi:hypothetical protein R6Q59_014698 [Mikania micrantha]